MSSCTRRAFLEGITAAALLSGGSAAATTAEKGIRLGAVVWVPDHQDPDPAIARVAGLGLPTCQVGVHTPSLDLAAPLRSALQRHKVEATALLCLGPGRMVWDFQEGPTTIGLVPGQTRSARLKALKETSDLAKRCGIPAIHTHCGFIPEWPRDPLYRDVVAAIRDVASHAKANGQTFLFETGQETPITLLRTTEDVGLDNLGVNLDTANLILYGKGNPVDAMDVIGRHVKGMHAKDGLFPTDPRRLGQEVPIGQGRVDFLNLFRRLKAVNYQGPVTIEREIEGPQQGADIRKSKEYLEKLIQEVYGTKQAAQKTREIVEIVL